MIPLWIQALIWVLGNLPSIIRMIREIIDLINGLPSHERVSARRDLKVAARCAQRGDYKPLRRLRDRLEARRKSV